MYVVLKLQHISNKTINENNYKKSKEFVFPHKKFTITIKLLFYSDKP